MLKLFSASEILEKISETARNVFPKHEGEVFLFGSRARGESHALSDWDLLILTKEPIDTDEKFEKYISPFSEIGWNIGEEINPINYSREEWKERAQTLFYHNVMLDAIKL